MDRERVGDGEGAWLQRCSIIMNAKPLTGVIISVCKTSTKT